MAYVDHITEKNTPQSEPLEGMVPNNAGGHTFEVDMWQRLQRFLILGSDGGTYYVQERPLTQGNAQVVLACARDDYRKTVKTIAGVSVAGVAPKNSPAIFALALIVGKGSADAQQYALKHVRKVCRTGTHFFEFVNAVKQLRGMGRSVKRSLRNWYNRQEVDKLAYQIAKYQSRNGWSHRDVMRLCKPKTDDVARNNLYAWAVGKPFDYGSLPLYIKAVELAKKAADNDGNYSETEIAELIHDYGLVRENVPTQCLNSPVVWGALLDEMPMTAMIRNLGKMSSIGLLNPLTDAEKYVVNRLNSQEELRKSRIHPLGVLLAYKTYLSGSGFRGSLSWTPNQNVLHALNSAFYASFANVTPTGKNYYLAIDCSGSMSWHVSNSNLTCMEGAAAMALVTLNTEPNCFVGGFSDGRAGNRIVPMNMKGKTIDDAVKETHKVSWGATDCAAPMIHAMENKIEVDVFCIYTDNETWFGSIHPCVALKQYRKAMNRDAKLVVIGMTATEFTIADPADPRTMDVVGFDATVPQVISQWASDA